MHGPLRDLTPLIDLAAHRSLDLFFRVGQGYVARAGHGAGGRGGNGFGVSPFGLQSRAEARILSTLGPLARPPFPGFPPPAASPIRPA